MKIFLHFGAHKTASTHLQHNLNLNQEYLETKKVKYFRFHESEELRLKAMELRGGIVNKNYDVEKAGEIIKEKINQKIAGYKMAIISYEGILGHMNLKATHSIYPNFYEIINFYNRIFENHNVTPVFVTRNYHDYILSSFKYQIKHGRTFKISKYIEDFKFDTYRWTVIIETLYENFNKLIVWTYEDYKKNPKKIFSSLLNEILKDDMETMKLEFIEGRRNAGSNEIALKIYYAANKLLKNRWIHTTRKKRYTFNDSFVDKHINKFDFLNWVLPNCLDVDLKNKNKMDDAYKEEIDFLKNRAKYKFL